MKWFLLISLYSSFSVAALKFPSERLKVMDIETLQRIVSKNLNMAQKTLDEENKSVVMDGQENSLSREDGARLIRESLELVFARPDQNNATSVIYSNIEGVAAGYGGVYKQLVEMTQQALKVLNQSGEDKALLRDQNTYVYILNNMMSEIKPLALSEEGLLYRQLIEKIRDSDIQITNSLKAYRALNSLSNIANPSKVARQIIGKKKCSWWKIFGC